MHHQILRAAPFFSIGVRCDDDFVVGVDFLPPAPDQPPSSDHALSREAGRQLRAWLQNSAWRFTLPLKAVGTAFQQRVWREISAIPHGETRSYKAVAAQIASAPRPVGAACGANPLPIFIPCHRIIAMNGQLCGFAHGRSGWRIDVKRWLLAREASGKA
jgi:methylated-DNA-[protein]-cysteine S-methyltransferase